MSIFTQHNMLFLRDPVGGVEDVQAMKDGGFGIVACNVQKEISPDRWSLVRERADSAGVIVVPWCYIWNLSDLDRLISVSDSWAVDAEMEPALVPNPEKQLDLGVFSCEQMNQMVGNRDAACATEAWLYNDVDWKSISHWPMMLEIFPYENPTAWKWYDCKKHARDLGFSCVMFTFGAYDVQGKQPQPNEFPLLTPYQIYTADDLTYCYPHYEWWGPRGTLNPCGLPPLTEAECPYTGPYYPTSVKYRPHQGKTVKALKIAMHRLKFGYFPNPSEIYGDYLKNAMYKFQVATAIPSPTGNYGKRSWEKLLVMAVDGEYAFTAEALQLIQEDVK
jgi:hypothetical protein